MKRILKISPIFFLAILLGSSPVQAQDWVLEKEFDGIQIYTRLLEGDLLKELKIEFTLNMKLTPIVSLLNDSEQFDDWVYNSNNFKPLESSKPGNGIFYGEVDFPWPMDDRDYVIQTTTNQNPETKVVTIESKSTIYNKAAEKDCFVRIPKHHNRWVLTPMGENEVSLEYWLKSDPGGDIPRWLINLAIDKGATQTIKNMKQKLADAEADVRLAYIQEK